MTKFTPKYTLHTHYPRQDYKDPAHRVVLKAPASSIPSFLFVFEHRGGQTGRKRMIPALARFFHVLELKSQNWSRPEL